jgi:putative peptidoglycan lipid II flippase
LITGLFGGAIASKLVGLIREVIQARLLGTSVVADSFRGALGVALAPVFPLQGEVIGSVLIPLHRDWKSEGVAVPLFSSLVASFFFVTILIAAMAWIFADLMTDVLVGGFGPEARRLTAGFVRILALMLPAYVLSTIISSAEIALGRPRTATLRGSAQNLGMIGGIFTMYFTRDAYAIAYGVVVAVDALALYGGLMLWNDGELALRYVRFRDIWKSIRIFLRRMRGLYIQPLTEQVMLLAERLLASMLATGTLASLDYARTFTDTALILVSQPLGYLVLAKSAPRQEEVPKQVMAFAGPLLGVGIPTSLLLVVFAPDVVRIVLARGAFDEHAVALTAGALRGISAGLWAATLGWVLVRMLIASDRRVLAGRVILLAFFTNIAVDLVAAPRLGSLGLGMGEGTRGLVLLIGAVIGLRAHREVASSLARVLPFVGGLGIGYVVIEQYVEQPLVRVTLAAAALLISVFAWFFMTAPDASSAVLRRYRASLALVRMR